MTEGQFVKLEGIKDAVMFAIKTIRSVTKNPDITPAEKSQIIGEMLIQAIDMATLGNQIVEDLKPKKTPEEAPVEDILQGEDRLTPPPQAAPGLGGIQLPSTP